jgi:hypothetical protein
VGVLFSIWYIPGFLILLFVVSAISFTFYNEKEVSLQILVAVILFTLGIFKIILDSKYTSQNQISNFITRDFITAIEGEISDPPKNKTQTVQFVIESESVYKVHVSIPVLGGVDNYSKRQCLGKIPRFSEIWNEGKNIQPINLAECRS